MFGGGVAVPPGGPADTLSRLISPKLSEAMGQAIVIDNRAGANGNIGTDMVAKAPADGYTLLMAFDATMVINPSAYAKLPFDPVKDLAPITPAGLPVNVLNVHPSLPVKNVKEFIALAKSKPNELNYGSAGNGSGGHLFTAMFGSMAGVKLLHIPYRGASFATTAVLSGETIFMFDNIVTTLPLARANKLRALAVTTAR